ncbi:polysaccharide deacetylase family protein [Yinghuangia soli]|uniref:Polysaccharide deacetylase family protein n=1 Tax=Yinghuangia soli TaxID=2908204 RepID=A0AA41U1U2_9ACTN|nr:polysaccharide deacetylase family protein [Yinghuangia soli]MCF2526454.1 polysaccharide deacetylase family protein [Yinghuangia soli]
MPDVRGSRANRVRNAVALIAVLALTAIGCASGGGRHTGTGSPAPTGRPSSPGPQAAPDPHLGRGVPPAAAPAAPEAPVPPQAGPPPAAAPPAVSDALVRSTAGSGKKVALTFDDGPDPLWTPQVLALLDEYGAKATFCVVGEQARAHPGLLRRIVAKGHRLCDHSESHDQAISKLPEDRLRNQITGARDAILAALPGVEIAWFRAPGGDWSSKVRATAAGYGMKPLDWTVDSRDWERQGPDKILANVKRGLRPGGVVLMHDSGGERAQTVAALRRLLPWLVAQGYSFDFPA